MPSHTVSQNEYVTPIRANAVRKRIFLAFAIAYPLRRANRNFHDLAPVSILFAE
jgi:hypothetical protein